MTRHEWKVKGEDGVCHYRATHHAGKWEVRIWREGSGEEDGGEWEREEPVSRDSLCQLLDLLQRKYQRRRVPFEQVQQVERMIEAAE